MKVKIANKRRFIFSCIFFTMMCTSLGLVIHESLGSDKKIIQTAKEKIDNSLIAIAGSEEEGIIVEENEYFKKYIFQFPKSIKNAEFVDVNNHIEISFDKNDFKNIKLNSKENIKIENLKDSVLIKINKEFKEENYVFVHDKQIVVLISKKEKPYKFKVVLDPGHGGIDKGTNRGNIYEKDLVLKIARNVEQDLIYKGCKVFMTRKDDIGLSLKERYTFANSKEPDVFVSVHVNSNRDSIYKGVSTYYYDLNGIQKEERKKLANNIQTEMIKSDNWKDRGIIRKNLAVLRGSTMPSVLVECGFLTNYEDRNKLIKEDVLENFGKNISNGILKYINAKIKHE